MFKQKDVKKMSRKDLLELLVLQSKKIEELTIELNQTKGLLNSKQIMIAEAGSIAEASLKINKIFEIAQEAANQYLENVKNLETVKKDERDNKRVKNKKVSTSKKKKIKKNKES